MGCRTGQDGCGKVAPQPGFDPRTVQRLASVCTDCVIQVHSGTYVHHHHHRHHRHYRRRLHFHHHELLRISHIVCSLTLKVKLVLPSFRWTFFLQFYTALPTWVSCLCPFSGTVVATSVDIVVFLDR